ncbi:hypothetical protein CASFOL_013079 [Castilleja foliolosa]|uniref:Uncharacterized protein n=1 Tax=Castilleja foliolosa TaxID=1961234 RepID=A0ABD3DMS1_9LAMI
MMWRHISRHISCHIIIIINPISDSPSASPLRRNPPAPSTIHPPPPPPGPPRPSPVFKDPISKISPLAPINAANFRELGFFALGRSDRLIDEGEMIDKQKTKIGMPKLKRCSAAKVETADCDNTEQICATVASSTKTTNPFVTVPIGGDDDDLEADKE